MSWMLRSIIKRGFATLQTPFHRIIEPKQDVTLVCWIQSFRKRKGFTFVDLSDGLSTKHLQAIIPSDLLPEQFSVGASIKISGDVVTSHGKGQQLELKTKHVVTIGPCDVEKYAFRPRKEYNEKDFCHVQTPIITSNDCEGAGEVFDVVHKSDTNEETYFPQQCHLTVSSQLHLEAMVHSVSRVYTIQPAFRAENALSRRHLCEFAMLEAEMLCQNLDELVQLSEDLIKHSWQNVKDSDDFAALNCDEWRKEIDRALTGKFVILTYDQAIEELERETFQYPIRWGVDLKTEHEEHLVRNVASNRPVIIMNFPAGIKPFYMKNNGKTVECFDILLPMGGEIVGGSMREPDFETLQKVIREQDIRGLEWYLDLRRFGSIPHGGFGLGIDRLLQYFTNTKNIKETVPFPRWRNHCQA